MKRYGLTYDSILGHKYATQAISDIVDELQRAEMKHPGWPTDKIHACAVMVAEAGEAMDAALDCVYDDVDVGKIKAELVQTGAMCVRALMHLR